MLYISINYVDYLIMFVNCSATNLSQTVNMEILFKSDAMVQY